MGCGMENAETGQAQPRLFSLSRFEWSRHLDALFVVLAAKTMHIPKHVETSTTHYLVQPHPAGTPKKPRNRGETDRRSGNYLRTSCTTSPANFFLA